MTLLELVADLDRRARLADTEGATAPVANVYRLVLADLATVNGNENGNGRPATPPDAILTQEQAAALLGISTRTLRKLPIKRWAGSRRLVRYLARNVIAYLEEQST